jgi:hypothetical protein
MNLSQVTRVVFSEWENDYFISPPVEGVFHVYQGSALYEAVTELIAEWEQVPLPEISAIEYRRPE